MDNEKTKFNFAAVFSVAVLLIYTYISFLGLVYWKQGDLLIPFAIALGFVLLVLVCLYVMSIAKATRWKSYSILGQGFFGLIILAAFLLSAVPFTNFMRVLEKQDEIKSEIKSSFDSAKQLDDAYAGYAKNRIDNYKSSLIKASEAKSIRPSEYKVFLEGAAGNTDEEKTQNLVNSLTSRLLPDSIKIIKDSRLSWLEQSSKMSVLNMKLPSNIVKICAEVSNWTENYRNLSSTIYNGEDASAFDFPDYNSKIKTVTDFYTKLHKPSFFAIICSIICFIIMLLPYLMTLKSNAGKSSNDKMYE